MSRPIVFFACLCKALTDVIDRGDARVKMTTDMWRAKPLKADLVLAAMTGKTGLVSWDKRDA